MAMSVLSHIENLIDLSKPIKVLVVDDSAFMRKMITQILSDAPGITVVGQARDGADGVRQITLHQPDVVAMDIEMPIMDGITALKKIMEIRPTPVVMVSSLTQAGAEITLQCLDLGAVDFVGKPSGSLSLDIEKVGPELISKVRIAAGVKNPHRHYHPIRINEKQASTPTQAIVHETGNRSKTNVLIIGSSTGGPRALQTLVPQLPANIGLPVLIVQHMPATFTATLAKRLDQSSAIEVREAKEGDRLVPNVALVAPGGFHMEVNEHHVIHLTEEPPVHGVRPSVDMTIASLTKRFGGNIMAVLLTGMGKDGARGLKNIRDLGGLTIAEAESTCVIYGMPRAAVELGGVEKQLPLHEIADYISKSLNHPSSVGRNAA